MSSPERGRGWNVPPGDNQPRHCLRFRPRISIHLSAYILRVYRVPRWVRRYLRCAASRVAGVTPGQLVVSVEIDSLRGSSTTGSLDASIASPTVFARPGACGSRDAHVVDSPTIACRVCFCFGRPSGRTSEQTLAHVFQKDQREALQAAATMT
ncbi:hypothetical protein VFPFJ_03191 [Purpureocillium lilacinum]|uniref:Uncharacterized protein n=1 Tax=Purpureocillium lilacinum TaxID=33203 RepID=A0A179GTX3_PURLI|nr:hypothetical protein VFPFJ_03191 [Purpureocillium lilacinum]OAQ81397.1 hypothetical protein VFPBJ_03981 [Purpureocillium lilacinum]OAQ91451.1 hypothetical protein VFPFJ_03191 [Purpureocillium lilacinum]